MLDGADTRRGIERGVSQAKLALLRNESKGPSFLSLAADSVCFLALLFLRCPALANLKLSKKSRPRVPSSIMFEADMEIPIKVTLK